MRLPFIWGTDPPAPPPFDPPPMLERLNLQLLGVILVAHFTLFGFFYLIFGNRRNTGAVMGGADSDNVKISKTEQGSLLATVLAYNILAVVYASFCAYTGTMAWFDGSAEAISGTLFDRLYGYSEPYANMAAVTIAYEAYNTAAVLYVREYCNIQFFGHHVTCLALGIMSMHPFCHYYGTFFFGLTAISSVPLALIELTQCAGLEAAQEACRVLFCIVFLAFRTIYWPIESYKYWCDALAALNGEVIVHSHAAHLFLLLANIGLTGLQFFWTTLIFRGIAEKLKPSTPKKAA